MFKTLQVREEFATRLYAPTVTFTNLMCGEDKLAFRLLNFLQTGEWAPHWQQTHTEIEHQTYSTGPVQYSRILFPMTSTDFLTYGAVLMEVLNQACNMNHPDYEDLWKEVRAEDSGREAELYISEDDGKTWTLASQP